MIREGWQHCLSWLQPQSVLLQKCLVTLGGGDALYASLSESHQSPPEPPEPLLGMKRHSVPLFASDD